MRRRPRDHDPPAVVEVVLVEDGVPPEPGAAPPARRTTGPRAAGQRRLGVRTRLAAVLGAMALLAAGGVLQARHEADVAAALARDPALVRPLHAPPGERWHVPDAWVSGVGESGVLVTSADGRLRAIEPATGRVQWSSGRSPDDGSGWCSVLHRAPDGSGLTRAPTADAPAVLAVCEHGRWLADGDGGRVRLTRATALDATTGTVLGERVLEGGLLLSDVVEGDLLHAWADAAGRVGVVRWDPGTGEVRWEHRGERRVTEQRGNGARVLRGPTTVTFVGAGTLTVDLASGRERVAAVSGRARDDVVGAGAVAGALLRGARASGAGLADGVTVLAELDGVAVLTDGTEAAALRLADGRELWRLPLVEVARLQAVTDGAVLALPLRDDTANGALVAVVVRTGTELWRTPLPAHTQGVRPAHGLVLVEAADGVTALG